MRETKKLTAIQILIQDMEALKKTKLYENSFKAIDDCIALAYAQEETKNQSAFTAGKLPTAEKTLEKYFNLRMIEGEFNLFKKDYKTLFNLVIEAIKYQNKLHVEAALKEALEEVPYGGSDEVTYEDVKGILTCYPPENIK